MTLQPPQAPPKPLSPWLSIPIILLCLAGGGWMVHWYVNTGGLDTESTLLSPKANAINAPVAAQPVVRQESTNVWSVHTREAAAMFSRPGKNKPFGVRSLSYVNYQFVPREQRDLIFAARRLTHDTGMDKSLKVTDAQLHAMTSLTGGIGIIHTPAETARLVSAWDAYNTAPPAGKPAAEQKLVAVLTHVAEKNVTSTKSAVAERADKIKAVLSSAQWKQYQAMGK